MKSDRPNLPPALFEVLTNVCPEGGFAFFGGLIEELDSELQRVAVPRELLEGGSSSEAGARALQGLHETLYGFGDLPRLHWWEHG
jgi:hypothetical protein